MKARQVINRLDLDISDKSGRVRQMPGGDLCDEVFVSFPSSRGCMWVRMDGSYVSGWTDHGAHFGRRFGFLSRIAIRRALKEWSARKEQPND